jgi:phospholipid/cholesterol/gamma-HCH transport system ATP-binding protein
VLEVHERPANPPAFFFVRWRTLATRLARDHFSDKNIDPSIPRSLDPSIPRAFKLIRLVDVYKSFGPKRVLQGFTLDVLEGETMVIIGYSGSGKSVAIKHIVGLLEPDSGQVIVDDLEVPKLSRRELYKLRARIGYVFQFAALFDSFTIGDNVAMGLRKQQELSDSEIERRVHEALDLVDLPNVADRFPAELSGGMRKRVGIARAIALRPKYILYDEPTTGLDPVTSAVIDQLMVRMRDTLGVTGIVITHDMRSAYTVGTRIAMLYEGRVRQAGTVDEIRQSTDPIVRQFIEGKANLDLEEAEQSIR